MYPSAGSRSTPPPGYILTPAITRDVEELIAQGRVINRIAGRHRRPLVQQ